METEFPPQQTGTLRERVHGFSKWMRCHSETIWNCNRHEGTSLIQQSLVVWLFGLFGRLVVWLVVWFAGLAVLRSKVTLLQLSVASAGPGLHNVGCDTGGLLLARVCTIRVAPLGCQIRPRHQADIQANENKPASELVETVDYGFVWLLGLPDFRCHAPKLHNRPMCHGHVSLSEPLGCRARHALQLVQPPGPPATFATDSVLELRW